jgi:hypothetical protein
MVSAVMSLRITQTSLHDHTQIRTASEQGQDEGARAAGATTSFPALLITQPLADMLIPAVCVHFTANSPSRARFDVLTGQRFKIKAFRDVTPCRLVNIYRHFEDATLQRNAGDFTNDPEDVNLNKLPPFQRSTGKRRLVIIAVNSK